MSIATYIILREFPREHVSGKQGKCITLAIFALRKCLLGCPQTRRELLVTVTRGGARLKDSTFPGAVFLRFPTSL